MSSDRDIVATALAGKPGAFAALVDRHQKLVWHMVYRMVHDEETTRDLCQEVFLRVHRELGQFRFESALSTWIGRIAFSVGSRHLRRKRLPLVEHDEGEESPLDAVCSGFDLASACADAELQRHLDAEISALPPLQRTVVTLYHLDELGIGEVSAITGLPAGTVKSHLFRARLRLRQRLEAITGDIS